MANQVTLLFGYIPPPKRKKPEAKVDSRCPAPAFSRCRCISD